MMFWMPNELSFFLSSVSSLLWSTGGSKEIYFVGEIFSLINGFLLFSMKLQSAIESAIEGSYWKSFDLKSLDLLYFLGEG